MPRPEVQGQPFRPSASREREITQALQQARQTTSGVQPKQFTAPEYAFVYARIPEAASVATIAPFQAVYFDGPDPVAPNGTTNAHLGQRIANCFHFTEAANTFKQWGIALDTITKTDVGRVLVAGVSWLDTSTISPLVSDATHINLIDQELVCGYNGRATILQDPTQPHCLVELAERRSVLLGKTKTAGLNPDVVGEVFYVAQSATGWAVTTITLPAWPVKTRIPKDRLVVLLPVEGKYIAVDATSTQLVRFTLLDNMRDESSADAVINSTDTDNGDVVTVTRWAEDSEGDSGDRGIAWYDGETYWVIELGTPVRETISFVASSTPAFGAVNAPQTFAATVTASTNPNIVGDTVDVVTSGRTRVKIGMRGSAFLDFDEVYNVIELQQPAHELIGTLSDDLLPSDTTATAVTVDRTTTAFPADVLPTGATITAQNLLRLHGFNESKVLLRYDAANDNYFIAQVYGYADRIVGSITADFDSIADEVDMGGFVGLNGLLSPALVAAGSATVQNTHSWEGKAGGRARAEYNWTAEQWEFYQIDCAEEQGSPPGSGPGEGEGGGV